MPVTPIGLYIAGARIIVKVFLVAVLVLAALWFAADAGLLDGMLREFFIG